MTTQTRPPGRRLSYAQGQLDRATLADDAPLRFVASSTGVNRYGFALRNEGWRLDNHAANPVFLWMHDPTLPPLGRAPAVREHGELACYVTFDRGDDFALKIESKYRRGFMNAVSVGWDFVDGKGEPVDTWRMSPAQIRDDLFYDLAEISGVPVPGDPRALQKNARLGLSMLGHQLVDLFDEQEHGEATADEVRAAVHAELARLGVQIPTRTKDPEPAPPVGSAVSEPPEPPAAVAGVDQAAADAVLAAFNLGKDNTGE